MSTVQTDLHSEGQNQIVYNFWVLLEENEIVEAEQMLEELDEDKSVDALT